MRISVRIVLRVGALMQISPGIDKCARIESGFGRLV
jgi:hypothetical protein